jgi:hypothetical protein
MYHLFDWNRDTAGFLPLVISTTSIPFDGLESGAIVGMALTSW